MKLNSLTDVLTHTVQDLYSAETQLIKALPKMATAASDSKLKRAFETHLGETEKQVTRLEKVCEHLNVSPKGVTCEGMKGLIKEGQEVIDMSGEPAAKDAALISASQKIEHYEIAGYGSAHTYAKLLNMSEVASLLEQSLAEEGNADKKLTTIAESLNPKAAK